MATGLAFNVLKSAQAAMGSAVFGPWSAVTSSALASYWRRKKAKTQNDQPTKENDTGTEIPKTDD